MNEKKPHQTPFERSQEDQARMKFLEEAGVNPAVYAGARMSESDGFELPQIARQHVWAEALMNVARRKNFCPLAGDPAHALPLGKSWDRGITVSIPLRPAPRILTIGASGSGKSNFVLITLDDLRRRAHIRILVWEYKPEIGRIIPVWKDAILFTPRTAPWKFLQPVGNDPLAYFISLLSEIRLEFEVRPETIPLMWQVVERMLRGMRPGDPPFSWEDYRRVLEHEAIAQRRENLFTAARAILNICVVLGPQAAARIVPEIPDRYRVIGYSFVGQDPALLRLFLGFDFTRLLFAAQERGHTTEFRQLYVFDEGNVLFASELMNRGVAQLSAAKRFVTMCRFAGTGFIIGAQNLCQLDPFVTGNCDVLCAFRCPSVDDATLAAKMLGLQPAMAAELMRLPTGVMYARAADWEAAVKVKVPLFEP